MEACQLKGSERMRPVISVIVPIYNQEKYVGDCLQSMFSQADGQIEFILINDGSTDKSAEICRAYMEKFPVNARLINQPNRGLIRTREIGVRDAKGEYILFVDSDDELLENTFSTLLDAIHEKRPDVILFNHTSDPVTKSARFQYPFESGSWFTGDGKYPLYQLLCCTDKLNNIWAKCVRSELYADPNVYDDIDGISNGEDLYQSLVLIDIAETVYFIDKVLYHYRVGNTTMSRSYNPKHFFSEKKVCPRRIKYAQKWSKNGDELVSGAKIWICKILRDVSRKAFLCDKPWPYIRQEMQNLRNDAFYREYYYKTNPDPNPRDLVLKSPLWIMRILKAVYSLKARLRG